MVPAHDLADVPSVLLARSVSYLSGGDALRAAAAARLVLDAAVSSVRRSSSETPSFLPTWRATLRWRAMRDRAFVFDQWGSGMEARNGGEWLRCWSGALVFGRHSQESRPFAFYRLVSDWDSTLRLPLPETLPPLSRRHHQVRPSSLSVPRYR